MIGSVIAAWLDVRTKLLRTLAAIAGMVAAILALVVVDAAGDLSNQANAIYLARRYGRAVTASVQTATGQANLDDRRRLLDALAGNGFTAVSTDQPIPATITYQGQPVQNAFRLVQSKFADIYVVDVIAGEWPTDVANSTVLHVVLNEGFAGQALGLSDQQVIGQPLGYALTNGSGTFNAKTTPVLPMIVDAVVATDSLPFQRGDSPVMVVSSNPSDAILEGAQGVQLVVRVNPTDFRMLQDTVARVTDDNGRPLFNIHRSDQAEQLAPVLDQQRVTGRIVAIVALTVGGLGILGGGLASVRERAKEFGMRRALGASRGLIFSGVVVQTLIEVMIAAAVAIPLAAALVQLFARRMVLAQLPLPPHVSLPVSSAVIGLTSALMVGLVASLVPAANAARLSVVEALRG
jgi:putative ABC transport system permease protein